MRLSPPCLMLAEMERPSTSSALTHVVIAGGGFAALEAAVALRALAGDRVELTLVAPEPRFLYRPAATADVFDGRPPLAYDLPDLLRGIACRYERGALEAVSPTGRTLRLDTGRRLAYDALILAVGARRHASIPGALIFRDQRDVPRLRRIIGEVTEKGGRRIVFAVPSANAWALPVYELALLFADHMHERGADAELTLCTPESAPLEVFGGTVARAVGSVLLERGITFLPGVTPHAVSRDGALELEFDAPIPADGVVTVPDLRGERIPGVPGRWLGFVPTDAAGRVEGIADVYAAGDATTFPIKQGGLATQQADRVAQAIAQQIGVPVHDTHHPRVLQARLLTGRHQLFLRCEIDDFGQAIGATIDRLERSDPVRRRKVLARYLEPYLARHQPLAQAA